MSTKTIDELLRDCLGDARVSQLRTLFGASGQDADAIVEGIVSAAVAEYAWAFLDAGPLTRAEEVQQQRLLHLLQHGAFPTLPSDAQLARLFHTTPTRARTLLRNVLDRFAVELTTARDRALTSALTSATRDKKNVVTLYLASPLIADGLQDLLDDANANKRRSYSLKRLVRDADVRGKWSIPYDAYRYLCEVLNIQEAPQT